MEPGDVFAVFLVVLAVVAAVPLLLVAADSKRKERAKLPGQSHIGGERMTLVRCDCGAGTRCPQGRDPQAGDPYRCRIWKME